MEKVIRSYLENTQVYLQTAHWTHVPASWGETLASPPVTRFYYFRGGSGWIRLRNQTFRPLPGQLFLLPAGHPVEFGTDAADTFRKYWCHFQAAVGEVNLFRMLELPPYVEVRDEAGMESRFLELMAQYRSSELTAPLRMKRTMLEILATYVELALEQKKPLRLTGNAQTGKINQVLAYIDSRLKERITIEELAKLVHFHPNYFVPYFKSLMGDSPIAYVNRKRMELAKRLLTTSELSVTDIAAEVGLELYYFSRMFKKQTGLSPSDYRQDAVR
jgi:AraC-like DNA-binding protein